MDDDFKKQEERKTYEDIFIDQPIEQRKFDFIRFVRFSAKEITFKEVSFKYCIFENCYLKKCKFINCDFTGSQFRDSNLKDSSFSNSQLQYSRFNNTIINDNILDYGMPALENQKLELARSLRVNFNQIGNSKGVNKAIHVELSAMEEHLYKAAWSNEYYYRNHYSGLQRFVKMYEWMSFKFFKYFWGNGESISRLLFNSILFVSIIALILTIKQCQSLCTSKDNFVVAIRLFLGLPTNASGWIQILVRVFSYFWLSMIVTVMVRRFSKR